MQTLDGRLLEEKYVAPTTYTDVAIDDRKLEWSHFIGHPENTNRMSFETHREIVLEYLLLLLGFSVFLVTRKLTTPPGKGTTDVGQKVSGKIKRICSTFTSK